MSRADVDSYSVRLIIFFSSRRRHTRSLCDWSSDVCSSDLDERVIRALADAFTLHWSNADAENLSLMWSREGDIVHPDGVIERGREVIRANRTALFARPEYRGSKHPLTIGMIRCPSADVAVGDGKWELRGVTDEKG